MTSPAARAAIARLEANGSVIREAEKSPGWLPSGPCTRCGTPSRYLVPKHDDPETRLCPACCRVVGGGS